VVGSLVYIINYIVSVVTSNYNIFIDQIREAVGEQSLEGAQNLAAAYQAELASLVESREVVVAPCLDILVAVRIQEAAAAEQIGCIPAVEARDVGRDGWVEVVQGQQQEGHCSSLLEQRAIVLRQSRDALPFHLPC
jgi:hypothetical protein